MITLPDQLKKRCDNFGVDLVKRFKLLQQSTTLAVNGIEFDPVAQADAKIGECIHAIECGINVDTLRWDVTLGPDKGADMRMDDLGIDVKQCESFKRFMIWSYAKTRLFYHKDFDLIVLVKTRIGHLARGESVGWLTKGEFGRIKRVAGAGDKLHIGTWWVDQDQLHKMATYPGLRRAAA